MPALSDPFGPLGERLLKAGIAPRHVRRYRRELTEHLADLTAVQHQAGYAGEDAAIRARGLLGNEDDLVLAMVSQSRFRSVVARFPWLVFVMMPPFAMLLAMLLPCALLVLTMKTGGFVLGSHPLPEPQWVRLLATGFVTATNLLVVPVVAALFARAALLQRIAPVWPTISIMLMLLCYLHMHIAFANTLHGRGSLGVGFAPIFLPQAWKVIASGLPIFLAQSSLTLLPLFWLGLRRAEAAEVPATA